ncbi:MAG: hypothetical protein L6V85_03020 [Clostridiales bacterium]|nr:MAG: hypothetical protein L6V85_03020 [Clostridiales bacterium]
MSLRKVKVFKGWQDETGKIVSTKKEYTFVVKDGMVLTAVYQDKAPGGGTIDGEIAPAPDKKTDCPADRLRAS